MEEARQSLVPEKRVGKGKERSEILKIFFFKKSIRQPQIRWLVSIFVLRHIILLGGVSAMSSYLTLSSLY